METIDTKKLEEADKLPMPKKEENRGIQPINEDEFKALVKAMENPVEAQKELAVQIKRFLDKRISDELTQKGNLSPDTRAWVKQYNEVLDKLQKSLYGDRSVNFNIHKILPQTHSGLAAKIRKYDNEEVIDVSVKPSD